jgi:formiminotetrahydrofolate cyclodeaminase
MVAKLSQKESPNAQKISQGAEALLQKAYKLAEEDEKAFNRVMQAYKLPKNTEEEKTRRKEAIENALKEATRIPLETAKTMLEVLQKAEAFFPEANKNALSDMGVAVLLAHAGLQGALLNVLINLSGIKDKTFVSEHQMQSQEILEKGEEIAKKMIFDIQNTLLSALSPSTKR